MSAKVEQDPRRCGCTSEPRKTFNAAAVAAKVLRDHPNLRRQERGA